MGTWTYQIYISHVHSTSVLDLNTRDISSRKGVGGYCHNVGYIGMCLCEGYGFQTAYSGIMFSRKLINWLISTQKKKSQLTLLDSKESVDRCPEWMKTALDIIKCQQLGFTWKLNGSLFFIMRTCMLGTAHHVTDDWQTRRRRWIRCWILKTCVQS